MMVMGRADVGFLGSWQVATVGKDAAPAPPATHSLPMHTTEHPRCTATMRNAASRLLQPFFPLSTPCAYSPHLHILALLQLLRDAQPGPQGLSGCLMVAATQHPHLQGMWAVAQPNSQLAAVLRNKGGLGAALAGGGRHTAPTPCGWWQHNSVCRLGRSTHTFARTPCIPRRGAHLLRAPMP